MITPITKETPGSVICASIIAVIGVIFIIGSEGYKRFYRITHLNGYPDNYFAIVTIGTLLLITAGAIYWFIVPTQFKNKINDMQNSSSASQQNYSPISSPSTPSTSSFTLPTGYNNYYPPNYSMRS